MKFKQIPKEYFITILDRLTRFEPAYIRYERVFNDIINKFSLSENSKNMELNEKIELVEKIINSSIIPNNDFFINEVLAKLEEKYFNFDSVSYQYLSSRLNFSSLLNQIDINENLPKNVKWLKEINDSKGDILKLRQEKALLYPIEKIILCEGQTEYVLLENIFKLFNCNLAQKGIMVLPAGGKNQVARKFYQMIEYCKIPFFILLDKDALAIKNLIEPKLRENDKIYILESGEFEDLIPINILQKAINYIHANDYNCIWDDFDSSKSMVFNLENIYKKYGFGEFKKALFANQLNEFVVKYCNRSDFSNTEIAKIINALQI